MADSSGPSEKRRRISKLLSIRGVNVSMVSQVIGILEDRAPPRAVVRRVQSQMAEDVCTTIRLPLTDGTHFDWCVALPQQTLPYLYRECETFRDAVAGAAERQQWHMALYLDEVTPGNPLRPDNRRRMTAMYASIMEWGPFLRTEEGWLTLGVIRSSLVKTVVGGMANIVRLLLAALFLGPTSLSTGGVALGGRMVFIRCGRLLADEAAGKTVFNFRGASSLRPCMACKNVVSKRSGLADQDDRSYLVSISCADYSRFDLMSDTDMSAAWAQLENMESTLRRADFDKVQQAYGLNFSRDSLFADHRLRHICPPSKYTRDPMHVMLSGGVLQTELHLFLRDLRREFPAMTFATLRAWFGAAWQWPQSRSKHSMDDILSDARQAAGDNDGIFKCGASEALSFYPLLRYFVHQVVAPSGHVAAQRASLLAFFRIMDLLQAAKRGEGVSAELDNSISDAMRRHLDCYGDENIRPKHHYMFHMGVQPSADGVYLDAFVAERKHQRTKDAADPVRNTRCLERSALAAALCAYVEQVHSLVQTGFEGEHTVDDGLSGVFGETVRVGAHLRFRYAHYDAGDIVFLGHREAGIVRAGLQTSNFWALLLQPLRFVEQDSPTAAVWHETDEVQVLPLERGLPPHAACWYRRADGARVILER